MCNSMVERMNSRPLQVLITLEKTCKLQWKDEINKLIFAQICTKDSVTGNSIYCLLFGRKSRVHADFILKYQEEIVRTDIVTRNTSNKNIETKYKGI